MVVPSYFGVWEVSPVPKRNSYMIWDWDWWGIMKNGDGKSHMQLWSPAVWELGFPVKLCWLSYQEVPSSWVLAGVITLSTFLWRSLTPPYKLREQWKWWHMCVPYCALEVPGCGYLRSRIRSSVAYEYPGRVSEDSSFIEMVGLAYIAQVSGRAVRKEVKGRKGVLPKHTNQISRLPVVWFLRSQFSIEEQKLDWFYHGVVFVSMELSRLKPDLGREWPHSCYALWETGVWDMSNALLSFIWLGDPQGKVCLALLCGVQIGCRVLFLSCCICWDLIGTQVYGQFWRKSHEVLKRTHTALCLGKMFCKHLPGPFGLIPFNYSISLLSFCLHDSSYWGELGIKITHYHCVQMTMWF